MAEDLTVTIGKHIPPDLCFQVIVPFLDSDHSQTTQAAIKLLTSAIGRARKDQLHERAVEAIVPALIKVGSQWKRNILYRNQTDLHPDPVTSDKIAGTSTDSNIYCRY